MPSDDAQERILTGLIGALAGPLIAAWWLFVGWWFGDLRWPSDMHGKVPEEE